MTKELEALKRKTPLEMFKEIKELEVADSPLMTVEDFLPFMCKKVEQALTELKAIKEAKPSEALECLEKVKNYEVENHYKEGWNIILYEEMQEELDTIKQNLIKAEKLEKAWEIVKWKNVTMFELKCCSSAKSYNECISFKIGFVKNYELTQAEFDLLKEILKNE